MKIHLTVEVPTSADQDEVLSKLTVSSYHRRGLTLVLPDGYTVDVDLTQVKEGD